MTFTFAAKNQVDPCHGIPESCTPFRTSTTTRNRYRLIEDINTSITFLKDQGFLILFDIHIYNTLSVYYSLNIKSKMPLF